jgi:hypothetical protein
MITLKTLKDHTLQEVFDQVATHLLTQGKQALDGDRCLYRAPDGTKCAIGCLISDEEYKPEIEGHSIRDLADLFLLHANLQVFDLLKALQRIHDMLAPKDWEFKLKEVATHWNLEFQPPTQKFGGGQ